MANKEIQEIFNILRDGIKNKKDIITFKKCFNNIKEQQLYLCEKQIQEATQKYYTRNR